MAVLIVKMMSTFMYFNRLPADLWNETQINHLTNIADIVSDLNPIRFTSSCAFAVQQFSKITSVLNKRMKSISSLFKV